MRTQFARPGSVLWIIRFPFYFFRMIGLAPFSIKNEKSLKNSPNVRTTRVFKPSKLGAVYNVAITFFYISKHVTLFSIFGFSNIVNISLFQSFVQMLTEFSVFCTITLFWALRQRFAADVVNKILVVDDLLFTLNCASSATKNVIHLSVHTLLYIVAWIGLRATHMVAYHYTFLSMFRVHFPEFVIHCFVLQYVGVLCLVSGKLEIVNRKLLSLGNVNNTQVPMIVTIYPEAHTHTMSLLRALQNIHTSLCEVSRDLSEFYSFAILLVVTYYFVSLVYETSALVRIVILHWEYVRAFEVVIRILWYVILMYPLNMMLWSASRVVKEVKRTGEVINKLLDIALREDIKAELEEFSLQLLHRDVEFTACGFFPLDFTLMHSVMKIMQLQ